MRKKIILVGNDAQSKLVKGADFLANAVKSTLGPWGSNAVIEKGNKVTNDGVTIAREIELEDEIENRGAALIREAAVRTVEEVGDGTTTSITLAQAILKEALKYLPNDRMFAAKKKPAEIIKQIEVERLEINQKLNELAKTIESEEELIASAKVSVEDEELGNLIGKAQWKVGREGVLIAEETNDPVSSVEYVSGVRVDNGYATSLVVNNHEKQSLELQNVKVILTNHTVKDLKPFQNVIEQLIKSGAKEIVIVARAFTSEAVQICLQNVSKYVSGQGGVGIYPVNAPYTDQAEIMKDLASVLGGTFFHEENSYLDEMNITDVGFAKKAVIRRFDAIFTGANDENIQEKTQNRVQELQEKLKGEVSQFEKRNLQRRISQLTTGLGLVKVGAVSEAERKWKKDKCDDAIHAVRLAFQEGTIKGAGIAFKEIAETLPDTYILKKPLRSIYEQIIASAPQDFVIPEWVRDPVKVLRVALEKATSVAATFATAQIAIAWKNEKPRYVEEVNNKEQE